MTGFIGYYRVHKGFYTGVFPGYSKGCCENYSGSGLQEGLQKRIRVQVRAALV